MSKLFILCLVMTMTLFSCTQSASFHCQFEHNSWGNLSEIYSCTVINSLTITSSSSAIAGNIYGSHSYDYNNYDVEVFSVVQKGQIYYFPRNLKNFLNNLKGIQIEGTGLREIHQTDLKVFTELKELWLRWNELKILEFNLFAFNPKLKVLKLCNNQISQIGANVFDRLTNLKTLLICSNNCISRTANNDPTEVQNIIRATKSQCSSSLSGRFVAQTTRPESKRCLAIKSKFNSLSAIMKDLATLISIEADGSAANEAESQFEKIGNNLSSLNRLANQICQMNQWGRS